MTVITLPDMESPMTENYDPDTYIERCILELEELIDLVEVVRPEQTIHEMERQLLSLLAETGGSALPREDTL